MTSVLAVSVEALPQLSLTRRTPWGHSEEEQVERLEADRPVASSFGSGRFTARARIASVV